MFVISAGIVSAQVVDSTTSANAAFIAEGNVDRAPAEQLEVKEPVKILSKPRAPYPNGDTGGSICIRGSVTLRVTFQANGEVGKISVVSGLPYGATENAIAAARKIKFNPAKLNGLPVTSFKTIQYFFSEF